MSTTAPDYVTTLRDGWTEAMRQWLDQSTSAWDQWSQAWSTGAMPGVAGMPGMPTMPAHRGRGHGHDHHHGHHHDHGRDCDCDRPHDHHDHGRDCDCGRPHDHHDHGRDCDCGRSHDHWHGDHAHDHGGHDHPGSCHECGCHDSCACCVPEADVILHVRAGELRVIPFRLANHWRREREVTLEVGPWHVCSGSGLEVRAAMEEQKLVLAPCEARVVRLLVTARGAVVPTGDDTSGDTAGKKQPASKGADEAASGIRISDFTHVDAKRLGAADVVECASAYADVRFEGCARPQRVAIVVSPADCDAVDLCCDCGCC